MRERRNLKKLGLDKESIVRLTERELLPAAGGAPSHNYSQCVACLTRDRTCTC